MKNIFYTLFPALVLVACTTKPAKADLKNLSGDWEIAQAKMPDGQVIEYGINMTIDYFEIDSVGLNKGIRKKFMPQFDGTRLTNGIEERFVVIDSIGSLFLKYNTDYTTWIEEVIEISPTEFAVKNENDIIYRYKKFVPIVIEKEEE
ncbi:hypothetical protein K5I29_07595 [Flavobacterium agricola]|uniref:Lipocalin-like domain-containing protein n=1 Tax=Flavobacterium agricola TaxID=2870839 RepID=A0ABY6LVR8_9FLAO|nr:hypothetical protein [Flavobacterium agricola]UYW00423.1 hypothetical protein K5I29_07595 [Flavobacterium agricola]